MTVVVIVGAIYAGLALLILGMAIAHVHNR
jgi:hypothetical protein